MGITLFIYLWNIAFHRKVYKICYICIIVISCMPLSIYFYVCLIRQLLRFYGQFGLVVSIQTCIVLSARDIFFAFMKIIKKTQLLLWVTKPFWPSVMDNPWFIFFYLSDSRFGQRRLIRSIALNKKKFFKNSYLLYV